MDVFMVFVEWNEEMSVGVPEIDDQHKKLLGIINELAAAVAQGKGRDCLSRTLIEMAEYSEYHFNSEHAFFDTITFPETKRHVKQHIAFVYKIREASEKLTNKKAILSINLLYYLKDWLVNHIMVSDMKYARFAGLKPGE